MTSFCTYKIYVKLVFLTRACIMPQLQGMLHTNKWQLLLSKELTLRKYLTLLHNSSDNCHN